MEGDGTLSGSAAGGLVLQHSVIETIGVLKHVAVADLARVCGVECGVNKGTSEVK